MRFALFLCFFSALLCQADEALLEDPRRNPRTEESWMTYGRVMGLIGGSFSPLAITAGGEAEGGFCPNFFNGPAQAFSLGAAYAWLSEARFWGVSMAYRPYHLNLKSRAAPELRLRLGQGLEKEENNLFFGIGLQSGVRFPLTLAPGAYPALHFEVGALTGLVSNAPFLLWGAFGLGYYF